MRIRKIALSQLRVLRVLPLKSAVSPRTTSADLKPGNGMNRWTKPHNWSMHGSILTIPWRSEAWWWCFRIAKPMDRTNQDVVGENCVGNDAGLTDGDKMNTCEWIEHYARLLNVEFECPSNELPEVLPTAGPLPVCPRPWSSRMESVSKMESVKPAGPSDIIAEMLKAFGLRAGREGVFYLSEGLWMCHCLVGAVTVSLLPDVAWPEEGLELNSCLSQPSDSSHIRNAQGQCTKWHSPGYAQW